MADSVMFYYADDISYDAKAAKKFLKETALEPLNLLADNIDAIEDFSEKNLEQAFLAVMESTGLKLGKIAQPVRVALTGTTVSPGIFEVIEVLGKDKTVSRIKAAAEFITAEDSQQ